MVEHHRVLGMGHGVPLAIHGPDALGAEGPFLLNVGVSSTLEIVRSWGLLETLEEPMKGGIEAPWLDPVGGGPPPPVRRALGAGGVDVGAVIDKALRAAGLVR